MESPGFLRRRGLTLVCLLALLSAGVALLSRVSRGGGGATRAPAEVAGDDAVALAVREPLPAAPDPPRPGTARAFLAEYHGERWPELEAAMDAAKLPLDQPFEAQTWEEVEPALRAKARLDESMRRKLENRNWVSPLTNEWLQATYQLPTDLVLDGAELAELESLVVNEMQALQSADKAYADRLDFNLQAAFEQGEYVAAPFSIKGLSHEMGFFTKAIVSGSWAAGIVLRDEECPDVIEVRDEIMRLVKERDRRVQAFLQERRGR